MPDYRRLWIPGGTYFFTVVTYERRPILCEAFSRKALHDAISETRIHYPLTVLAWVLLPDHLHCIWRLPEGDADFATRWRLIKSRFTRAVFSHIEMDKPFQYSRERHRERYIWQRRFWEHCLRGEKDLNRHTDYIHYNPVKHGFVEDPGKWPFSTFQRFEPGEYPSEGHLFDTKTVANMECE